MKKFILIGLFILTSCFGNTADELKARCEIADGNSCHTLGLWHNYGSKEDVEYNKTKSEFFIKKACNLGLGKACYDLIVVLGGNGRTEEEKMDIYKKGCDLDDEFSCEILGDLHYPYNNSKQDFNKSKYYYEKACKINPVNSSCEKMAFYSIQNPEFSKLNLNKALSILKENCNFYKKRGNCSYFNYACNLQSLRDKLQEECNLNKGYACGNLGLIYYMEEKENKDYKAILNLYQKGCDLKDGDSCSYLADYYFNNKQSDKATKILQNSCERGDLKQCGFLGNIYFIGKLTQTDYIKAEKYYIKNCELKTKNYCKTLISLYEESEKDPNNIKELFEQKCSLGNGNFCGLLGEMYETGYFLDENFSKALEFYNKANSLGHTEYYFNLDWLQTINKNINFEKILNICDKKLCYEFAKEYESSYNIGDEKALENMKQLYEKGCDLGDGNSCVELGYINYNDITKVKELYKKSCDLNNSKGCFILGYLYENGAGITKDMNIAKKMYEKACNLGNKISCAKIDKLK
ncbi:Sel1 domain-containing protein [Campylobacter blaseri]|uniref:beta-lactamase n=1 Tax=Campylobacter blaseri TaxID=2042961 RepID=A0A2P8R3L4_9BACT|nr:tetratricopeptide repeat protein [Campylobacter blaseri]PSM53079.1 hypothetical protein CQ405_00565 [Campylobacter blaseri]PSM54546.1 hypothetical protein CRN67_00565 [Campylobacter blaseri]QKF86984.1 Sel1 domain-containing protein [Campylobacter blaseri]